jgi:hypothetical protein
VLLPAGRSSTAISKEEPDPAELAETVVIGNERDPGSASSGQPDELIRLRIGGRSGGVEEQFQPFGQRLAVARVA